MRVPLRPWRRWLLALALALVALSATACEEALEFIELLLAETEATAEPETGRLQVYFTVGNTPGGGAYHTDRMDELLAEAIDGAQRSVDVAAFDFELESVIEALEDAHARGVKVRLVTDDEYEDELGPQLLGAAGVPVVFDERSPFMHNKFIVIDEYLVWTGSWNLTDNGTHYNNNNVVVAESRNLAENYTREFEEMFEDGAFGSTSPDDTPHPRITLDGVLIENFFESEGDVRPRILELVEGAETSVYFMAFAFTDDDIARALVGRHRAGLDVRGVIDARNTGATGADFESMQKAGVAVLEDGNPRTMHHKVIIVDEAIVITGSYNFTASAAERNDENVLIIHSADIAAQYLAEFERVYRQAQDP